MSRPNHTSPRVRELAEGKIRAALARANGEDDDFSDEIKWLLGENFHDVYRLARSLEDHLHWTVDGSMLDDFEEIISIIDNAVAQAEREWFAGVDSPVKVGDEVEFDDRPKVEGTITKIDDQGRATVFCPTLGHVREGLGTHGRILPVEKLTVRSKL